MLMLLLARPARGCPGPHSLPSRGGCQYQPTADAFQQLHRMCFFPRGEPSHSRGVTWDVSERTMLVAMMLASAGRGCILRDIGSARRSPESRLLSCDASLCSVTTFNLVDVVVQTAIL